MNPVHNPHQLYNLYGSILVDYCAQVISRLSEEASPIEIRKNLIEIAPNFPLETEGIEQSMETHHIVGSIVHELSRLEQLEDEKRSLAWQMPLAREILWRCELYSRGETPSNYTLGVDPVSWIILAALGAALDDYEHGDDLIAAITRIDIAKAVTANMHRQKQWVLAILNSQVEAGHLGFAHYELIDAGAWDVSDLTVSHNFGVAGVNAGVLDENKKLRFRIESNYLTLYQRAPETLIAGLGGRPLRELIQHPLIDHLSYEIKSATSKPDRSIIDLEPLEWRQLKFQIKDE